MKIEKERRRKGKRKKRENTKGQRNLGMNSNFYSNGKMVIYPIISFNHDIGHIIVIVFVFIIEICFLVG